MSDKDTDKSVGLNWRNVWYPVVFAADLPDDKPYGFDIYGERFVVFRDGDGALHCLRDRCPHRAARLSDGQIVDGNLECLYHGWQFASEGKCVRIPQLASDKAIPKTANVDSYSITIKQGIVWVFPGESDQTDDGNIPTIPGFERDDMYSVDYVVDLPYDRGGGHRDLALPLEFDVIDNGVRGLSSTLKTLGIERSSNAKDASVDFVAPNLIHYSTDYGDDDLLAGLALYSIPLGQSRCRLLYRKYSTFYSWKERIKPRWMEHWLQNSILQQDMSLIIGQYETINESEKNLRDLWLPIKSCDALVIRYRKWLDDYGRNLPDYRGFSTYRPLADGAHAAIARDDFNIHTRQCGACLKALTTVDRIRKVLIGLLAISLPLLLVTNGSGWFVPAVLLYLTGLGMYWFTGVIKNRFGHNRRGATSP